MPLINKQVSTVSELLNYGLENSPTERIFNDWHEKTWHSLSYSQAYKQIYCLANGLRNLKLPDKARIAMFMNNDTSFCLYDLAISVAGYTSVPLHLTFNSKSIEYIFEHSEVSACICSNAQQSQLIKRICPRLQIINAEDRDLELCDLDIELPQVHKSDLLTIIYTSGTTGTPKGVALTHENLIHMNTIIVSDLADCIKKNDRELSFLPLSHIFAKSAIYRWLWNGTEVYFTNPDQIMMHAAMVKPQTFSTVPHLLEKVFLHIANLAEHHPEIDSATYQKCLEFTHKFDPTNENHQVMKQQFEPFYQIWRKIFGGELTFICSGGAPLRKELCHFYNTAGITILEGYGMTEAPVISCNPYSAPKLGSVGIAFSETDIQIAADGEILLRGPQVMSQYYKNPEQSQLTLSDGWLHTGDIGYLDEDRYLFITDRKKNIFKMITGEFIIPSPLENQLQADPMIAHALVIGANEKFCSALIFPDLMLLPRLNKKLGLELTKPEDLCQHPHVLAYYQNCIDRANIHLPTWSQIKKFALIPEALSPMNDLLTATLKLKRKDIKEYFKQFISEIYQK